MTMTAYQRFKRWYAKPSNNKKAKERGRRWYADHKALVRRRNSTLKARRHRRKLDTERRYGKGSGLHYEKQFRKQRKRCAICRKPLKWINKLTHRDHDHKTGQLRGMLCLGCNHGIGKFKDNHKLLVSASRYLKRWSR